MEDYAMKNKMKLGCLVLVAALGVTAMPNTYVYADDTDDYYADDYDDYDDDYEYDYDDETVTPEQTIDANVERDILITNEMVKSKAKTVKNVISITVRNQDYSKINTKLSYKVLSSDKALTFKNNSITIKKGTKAGKYKVKVQITSEAEGYDTKDTTVTITVQVKAVASTYTWKGKTYDFANMWMPSNKVLSGKYKVTYSGPYRIVQDGPKGQKLIKNGGTVTFKDLEETGILIALNNYGDKAVSFKVKFTKVK